MWVKLVAWHFQVCKAEDKPSMQGEWHFVSSVSFCFFSCASSDSLIRLCVLYERSSPVISICSSLSSAEDTVYKIRDGLRWSDEDRVSGGQMLKLRWDLAGTAGLHNLGLSETEKVVGCEDTCCQPFCSTVKTHFSIIFRFSNLTPSAQLWCLSLKFKTS